jgi:hypothetical protein
VLKYGVMIGKWLYNTLSTNMGGNQTAPIGNWQEDMLQHICNYMNGPSTTAAPSG